MNADTGAAQPQGELEALRLRVGELEAEVADLRQAAEAPRWAEGAVRALLDASMQRAALLDTDGRILALNDPAARASDKRPEELIGAVGFDFMPPELARSRKAFLEELVQTRAPVEYEDVREGRRLKTRTCPVLDANGEVAAVAICCQDATEFEQTEDALRRSEALYRTTVDAMDEPVHVVDRDLKVTLINQRFVDWCKALGLDGDGVGRDLLDVFCFLPEAIRAEYGRVIETGQALHTEEDRGIGGRQIVTETHKIPVMEGGQVARVLTVIRDVTERRKADAALREGRRTERRFRDRLAVLHEVTVELSKAETFDDLCRRSVELGLARLGFDRLGLWFTTDDPKMMVGSFGTDESGRVRDERAQTSNVIPESWARGILAAKGTQPLVERGVTLQDHHGRELADGMRAVAGMWDGERVIGFVVADDLPRKGGLTPDQCEVLRLYASAIGHLATRVRAAEEIRRREAAERRFREKLAALHEVTIELSRARSFDDLCRQAVQLGLSRLGYERMGLWFATDEPGVVAGTFGTDERGEVRDEHEMVWDKRNMPWTMELLTGRRTRPVVVPNVAAGRPPGEAGEAVTRLVAPMRDGERALGYVAVDNLLTRRPWDDDQTELLGLYAVALGHLASRVRAEEEIRRREAEQRSFHEQLVALHDITVELSKAATFDDLCRRAVELPRGRLGTDRLGIWFLTGHGKEGRGSFGTDPNGRTVDERGETAPVAPGSLMANMLYGQVRLTVLDDVDLRDGQANVVGRGAAILASLWDGERIIGCLCGDNLLTGRGISAAEREVMGLYASTVGHLCSRIRFEQALRESERRHRDLVDTCPDGIVTTTIEGRFLSANQAYLDMLGYTAEEFENVTYEDFTPVEWRHVDDEGIAELLKTGFGVREKEYVRKDGSRIQVSLTGWVLRDSAGRPEKLGAFVRDVTDERRARQALAESEARFRGLVANVPGIVYRLSLGGEYEPLFLSDSVERITGYPASDFIGGRARTFDSIVHPDDVPTAWREARDAAEAGQAYKIEYRILHADGDVRWVRDQGAVVRDGAGRPVSLDGVVYDITDAKETERQLQESRDRLEYVINNTFDIMFEIDMNGAYTFGNLAAGRVTGYPLAELLSMNMRDVVAPEYREFIFSRLGRRRRGKPLDQPFLFEIVHREGRRVMLEATTTSVYADGELEGVQGIARDVTRRTRAEQALREARARVSRAREGERRRLAGELHDSVGQGLIAIDLGMRGVLGKLSAAQGADPSVATTVEALCGQAEALLDEVRRVVRGLYPPTLESLGLGPALHQLVQDFAGQSTVKIECAAPEDLGRFAADVEIALFRVAQEAVTNAVRHGGASRVRVGLSYEADRAVLTVTDNGRGFDPAEAAGKGVGLARMDERARTLGGELRIESRRGRTRVTAVVPTEMAGPSPA